MKTVSQILGLLLILALASPAALAATYKYQDESGNTVYSQNPPENRDIPYEVMGDIPSRAKPGSDSPPLNNTSSAPSLQQDEEQSDTIAREQQQAEQMREENCEAAKKNLEIYTVYRRIRNEEGEVVRIDDEERQQKIDEAKQAIRDFCD
ncbi:DUF4124 domain-containing protein [Thiohalophilus sp.]|uniref:DUF4124 domain-containing protein n=1 Tax=Thiohalophilus sp. TaxID=3028392 RepID=UPI002ACE6C86|nr:DUF4124 domain-containing protein [Thiohalophilus sp.]MDZ7663505.1 DUF4124 domain-containing protein [Thiohalophilus sp.]